MNAILQWGLEIIRTVQRFQSPALDAVFKSVTALGSKEFYFLLFPLVLWCVDLAIGARIAVVFLLSAYVNLGLKDLFALPRPFELDPTVKLYDVEGYGLPSGHAQLSTVVWGTVADALGRTWVWLVAILMSALIGFSRIYLGVHFPIDVLAGWLLGALLLIAYLGLHPSLEKWLRDGGLGLHLSAAVVLPLALLTLHPTEDAATLTGILLGAGMGIALLRRTLAYSAGGLLWKRAVRFVIGSAVLLALRFGLKVVFSGIDGPVQIMMRFVRYAILGLWAGFGAPWLFEKLQLASDEEASGCSG
jgi:membrane-associated phospholipid phosphatase